MAQLLNPEDYTLVEFTHNIASCVNSKGKVEYNVFVSGPQFTQFQVVLNDVIMYKGPASRVAARKYNEVLEEFFK